MIFVNIYDYVLENFEKITEIKHKYLSLLGELTHVSYISNEMFFKNIQNIHMMGQIIIGMEENTIICSGTIIIEPKVIHGARKAGHIEDIVVLEKWRNKGIAKKLLENLKQIAIENDCYKIILDCKDELVPFYEKNEYSKKGTQMSLYF